MKYIITGLLLTLVCTVGWGEETYFCTMEKAFVAMENSQYKEEMKEQVVISVSEEQMVIKGARDQPRSHMEMLEPLEVIKHRNRFYTGRWISDANRFTGLLEIIWLLDIDGLKARRSVLTDFSSRTEWGECSKI